RVPPRSPPFPYTTLFRSGDIDAIHHNELAFVDVEIIAGFGDRGGGTVDLRNTGSGLNYGGELSVIAQTDVELTGKLLAAGGHHRSEEHTSELQSRENLVC